MKNRLFVLCTMLCACIATYAVQVWDGTAAPWTKGSGTESNPYLIETPANIAYLSKQVQDGNAYDGTYFLQTDDIDLNNKSWTYIGAGTSKPFSGIYDGGQKHILNIKNYLFGYIKSATIKNLTLAGATTYSMIYNAIGDVSLINCHNKSSSEISNGGAGLVTCAEYGWLTLKKCTNDAAISDAHTVSIKTTNNWGQSYYKYEYFVGGLIAKANKLIIQQCSNSAKIEIKKTIGGGKSFLRGSGIVGYADTATISISHNSGDINVSLGDGNSQDYSTICAGIGTIGHGNVISSYNVGNITSYCACNYAPYAASVGIVSGANLLSFCYSKGSISASVRNTISSNTGYCSTIGVGGAEECRNCYFAGYLNTSNMYVNNPHSYAVAVSGGANCYCTTNCGATDRDGVIDKMEESMKSPSFVSLLNVDGDYFYPDYTNINDGYPILRWQLEGVDFYTVKGLCREEQGTITGTGAYPKGAEIQLTATPKDNFVFAGWSDGVTDNPRTIKVEGEATYVAQFERTSYTIYVNQDCSITVE